MELIYSMRRKPLKCEPPRFESATNSQSVRPLCTISTANIIAFSSLTELEDTDGDTWGGHVYVCDLDTPWDSHKVTSTSNPVSALEWDIAGKQLLVATTVGQVSVYGQKDYLLNYWQCLYTASFSEEHIIKCAFFHNGRRILPVDKKPEAPVTERFQMQRFTPTLKGFGGVASEGAIVITATGLVGAVVTNNEGTTSTASEALRSVREHITNASIAYKKGGILISAISVEEGRGCVRCFLVAVTNVPLTLCCQPLPAIYLDYLPTSISWSQREDTDSLLIGGSTLSVWKCTERAYPVHKLLSKGPLQGSTTPGGGQKPGADSFNTVVWQKTAVWPLETPDSVSIASSKLSVGTTHTVLATLHALHLLATDTHHVLCSRQVVTSAPEEVHSPQKITKYGPGVHSDGKEATICHVDVSQLSCVSVCIDTRSQLHVFTLPQPAHNIPTAISIQHSANLLEYCIISGYDCLDLLMTLKPNAIEPLYERVTESFQRQPAQFQQYYYHTWLKIRIALCRLCPSLQCTASWLTCTQTLLAVLAALAPHATKDDLHDDDDDDKSIAALEAKPESISEAMSLQAMRLSLQRGLDIAVTAIAQLATHPHLTQHGHEIWTESGALTALRRVVVAARAGGRAPDAICRALSRLPGDRHKLDLYEECGAIAAQFSSARVWESLPRCTVSAPHMKPHPHYLEYGVEPEALRYVPEPPAFAQCETMSTPSLAMDSIRYMYLGGGSRPARYMSCSRCGSRALPAHVSRHVVQRAHAARFAPHCRCGAKWTLCSNI